MQGMDLDAALLYMPGDETDSSILLDTGKDYILLDDVDVNDTENISMSDPIDLHCNPEIAGRIGRLICLLGFWNFLSRAPALIVIIKVYVLYGCCHLWCYLHTCMRVSMTRVFILIYVLYEFWCCERSSLMLSVWALLILVYVLYGRCRRGYHVFLK